MRAGHRIPHVAVTLETSTCVGESHWDAQQCCSTCGLFSKDADRGQMHHERRGSIAALGHVRQTFIYAQSHAPFNQLSEEPSL